MVNWTIYMKHGIIVIVIFVGLSLVGTTSLFVNASAQTPSIECQSGTLITYVGTIFGLANVCTEGYTIKVDIAANYMPESGKVFEAWLVDDASKGSGYALSMGKILENGTLGFREVMTNAKTYTDILITQEHANDLSPLASWSNSVAQTSLIPPFGQ